MFWNGAELTGTDKHVLLTEEQAYPFSGGAGEGGGGDGGGDGGAGGAGGDGDGGGDGPEQSKMYSFRR